MSNVVIIGSGLSSLASTLALIKKGIKPIIVDIGLNESSKIKSDFIDSRGNGDIKSISTKTRFGHDYMYLYPKRLFDTTIQSSNSLNLHLSGGYGGLSTVWGAGLQTCSDDYLKLFPHVFRNEIRMAENYLLNFIPHTYTPDSINEKYPWPNLSKSENPKYIDNALKKILNVNGRKTDSLFVAGFPRLAIVGDNSASGCTLCGKCLSGCKFNSIFDSNTVFDKLIADNKINYIKGSVKKLVITEENHISVRGQSPGKSFDIEADRVLLGAGPIGTPLLLMNSNLIPEKIIVKDSQVFYSSYFFPKIQLSSKFALAQIILTKKSKGDKVNYTKFQGDLNASIYGFSRDLEPRVDEYLRNLKLNLFPINNMGRFFLRSLFHLIGFIDSEKSGKIQITKSNLNKVTLTPLVNENTASQINYALEELATFLRKFNFYSLPINLNSNLKIGAGFHSGSSLPMSNKGDALTDFQGRLKNHPNILIIDSSCLPDIPTGSISLTTMANAYRVASYIHI